MGTESSPHMMQSSSSSRLSLELLVAESGKEADVVVVVVVIVKGFTMIMRVVGGIDCKGPEKCRLTAKGQN